MRPEHQGALFLSLLAACAPSVEVPDPVDESLAPRVARYVSARRDAVRAAPRSGVAWGAYGEALDAHLLLAPARRAYAEARRLDPEEFRWAYHAACVADLSGAPAEELVALFEAARKLDAGYAPLHARYGDALMRQGLVTEARAAYEDALELDADLHAARRGLGRALFELDELAPARAELERAAAGMPTDRATQVLLAQVLAALGETDAARAAGARAAQLEEDVGLDDPLRRAVESSGLSALARRRRGEAHLESGRYAEARAAFEELVEEQLELQGEPDPTLLLRLGSALAFEGRFSEAIERFHEALRVRPGLAGAHAGLAQVAEARGDALEARRQWREAVSANPRNATVRLGYALLLGRAGETAAARRELETAHQLDPNRPEILHNLGTALMHDGELPAAEARLRAALALDPRNPDTHFNLGVTLEALGRPAEAAPRYRRALELSPGHAPARERLQHLEGGR